MLDQISRLSSPILQNLKFIKKEMASFKRYCYEIMN